MRRQSFGLSMGFEVQITDEAFGDLDAIAVFIKRQASIDIARKWFAGIIGTIETLGEMPVRCALAPEAEDLQDEVRLLLHGRKNRAYKSTSRSISRLNQAAQSSCFTFGTGHESL